MLFLLLLPVFASGQIVTTIAGNGVAGYSGDGGYATNAQINTPVNVKIDRYDNLYIADNYNNVIRKINSSGIITTVVGNGYNAGSLSGGGYTGNGGPATNAELSNPSDIVFDTADNMYIIDNGNSVIRKINSAGIITTIAGGGLAILGDNGPATNAMLFGPFGLVIDSKGNLFFSDAGNHRIRKINTSGIITTVAGNGTPGSSGDGGPATNAQVRIPCWLALSPSDELYIPDWVTRRVRKVDNSGIITTVAGNGGTAQNGDWGAATAASIDACESVAFDDTGNYYISNLAGCSIRKVNTAGIISSIIGGDSCGYGGDERSATAAYINTYVICSAVDHWGNVYFADAHNHRIRKITFNATAAINYINKYNNSISIYPNPAQNEVTIKSTTTIERVVVVNMMGQVVVTSPSFDKNSGQASSPKEREVLLNIQSLPAGVYFVKVNGPDGYRDGGRFVKE